MTTVNVQQCTGQLYHPCPQRLQGHWRKGVEKTEEPEDREECCEMLSFRHDTANVHRNSKQLELPTPNLYKIKLVKIPACIEESL